MVRTRMLFCLAVPRFYRPEQLVLSLFWSDFVTPLIISCIQVIWSPSLRHLMEGVWELSSGLVSAPHRVNLCGRWSFRLSVYQPTTWSRFCSLDSYSFLPSLRVGTCGWKVSIASHLQPYLKTLNLVPARYWEGPDEVEVATGLHPYHHKCCPSRTSHGVVFGCKCVFGCIVKKWCVCFSCRCFKQGLKWILEQFFVPNRFAFRLQDESMCVASIRRARLQRKT